MSGGGAFVCLAVPFALLIFGGIWWIAVHNRLVRLQQHVYETWADIDVELKRRHDLVPKLVATVKGYAAHERDVLERVVTARNAAVEEARPERLGFEETKLQRGLSRLFAVAEGYPQLKADRNFLELQHELALTEDRLAAARRFYNANVRELNATAQSFPASLVAGTRFRPAEYFEIADDAERVAPRIGL
ncbi:MAG: LemA family protein [Planctomycetota bacterium]